MDNYSISIIIPTYNRDSLLKEAIHSVVEQSYKDWELIIVDDGSTDGTEGMVPQHPQIRYIKQPHSGMPGQARNVGVSHAKSSLVAFLDSDDLWAPEKLERQLDFHKAHPQFLISHTREKWLRGDKVISQSKLRHKREGDIFSDALDKCIIGPSTVMMDKGLYKAMGGFREDLEIAEDYEFWLRICDSCSIGYIDEPLITKRAGQWEQLSEKYGQIEIFRIRALMDLVEGDYFTPPHKEMAQKRLAKKCRIYAKGALKRGREGDFKKYSEYSEKYS